MVDKIFFTYIKDVVNFLDNKYPHELAWDGDLPKIGFVLGNKENKLKNVLLVLDVTMEVIEEAINKNVNFIITHHPLIYNAINKIDYNTSLGKIIIKLIQNDISVYSMHTNLDVGENGVADALVNKLNLKNIQGANEKEAYLRYGDITPKPFIELLEEIKTNLKLNGLRFAGDDSKLIKRIGILGGSGGNEFFVNEALNYNVDLYISSEFKLSAAQLAVANNLCVIEINHGTEWLVFENIEKLIKPFINTEIYISSVNTDPFRYYK